MDLQTAIQYLKYHNKWRRGAEIAPLAPQIIGTSIDTVVNAFEDTMWKPIDRNNLPEDNVFVARAVVGEDPVFAHGCIVFEEDFDTPRFRCFVANCGGSYVVDFVTHYLDPTKIPATNDQTKG